VADRVNFTIKAGEVWSETITYEDENGAAINLTGCTAAMHIRRELADAATVATLTTENGRITITALTGTLALTLPAAVSELLDGEYVYDVFLFFTSNTADVVLIEGAFIVEQPVTRV